MIEQPPPYLSLLSGPSWQDNPYPAFEKFRRNWPIARVDWPRVGAGEWLVTKYSDIHHVLGSPMLSVNRSLVDRGRASPKNPERNDERALQPLVGTVLTTDPPDHTCLRRPLAALLAEQVEHLQAKLDSRLDRLLSGPMVRDSLDVMNDFAEPFAAAMISELMAIPPEALDNLRQWSKLYVRVGFTFGHEYVSPEVWQAVSKIKLYLSELFSSTGHARCGRLVSRLLEAYRQQEGSSNEHIVNTGLILLTAGMQTTKHAICNAVAALVENRGALSQLVADPNLLPLAVEECLRYDGPSQAVGRVATTDIELSGVRLTRGAFLRLALASANRDDDQFCDPNRLDVRRRPNRHLALGSGAHLCLGAQLARLATRTAVRGLLQHFRDFSVIPGGVVREQHMSLRGYSQFKVLLHRR